MRCLIFVCLAASLAVPSLALGGSAGNPASTVGRENFGVTLEMENQIKNVDEVPASSKRFLTKMIWGAADRLDLYARLGASDLEIEVPGAQDYHGKRGMTWGGGARFAVAELPAYSISAYADLQFLSFYTDGVVWRASEEDAYLEKFADRYKWNEWQMSFVAVWSRPIFRPYLGLGITGASGNVTKDVYWVTATEETYQGQSYEEFSTGAVPELIMGIDFALGGTGTLSGEIRYSDDGDVSFFVGASELLHLK
jgi:hypothetical protein